DTIDLDDPYSIHVQLSQVVLHLQNEAVWSIRTSVRTVEKSRAAPSLHFSDLHDLARHAIHVFETLDLAARTFNSMMVHHGRFGSTTLATDGTIPSNQHYTYDRLHFYNEAIQGLRLRSIANKDRLLNEIQLSFNIVAQNIASTSIAIDRALQSDSSALKTIALATAGFIPMTFVATLFSMSFFVYSIESGTWNISDKFWIYWAIAILIATGQSTSLEYLARQEVE
ncbi:MAG: hypothetical protein M1833_001478, partial [Piccolia ochrophora]